MPLTLEEAERWLARGNDVAVLLEAFSVRAEAEQSPEYVHNAGRAAQVQSGAGDLNVIAIFAGNALNQCPHLQDDNLCGIYEERPLVCRIYPMEINPFIELRAENKICPPESWGSGEILCSDGVANPPLRSLISQSKQADVKDAVTKVSVCESLGMTVASWKGNGLAVYFPQREALSLAIQTARASGEVLQRQWSVRTDTPELTQQLLAAGVPLAPEGSGDYLYQAL